MSRAEGGGIAALFRDYREFAGGRLWLSLGLILLGALAEGFGLLMIVPLASIAIGGNDSVLPAFARWISALSPDQRFLGALGLFLAAMAARSALLYARDVTVAGLQAGYEASLRMRAASTLARRGWPFASRIGQGGMQALLLGDVPRAVLGVAYLQQMTISAVMLAVPLLLTALLSPALTAVAMGVLTIGALASVRWVRRSTRSGFAIIDKAERSTVSGFQFHAGLKAALAQGTIRAFLNEYRASLGSLSRQSVQLSRDYAAAQQSAAVGAAVAAALLLYVGVRILALPFPVLIASLVLFARMSNPAQALLRSVQHAAASAPSFAAIERKLGQLRQGEVEAAAHEPLDWQELRLDGVSFEHQPGLGLNDASLALPRGEWIGISGASGAGKTTLVDLVAGLLEPQDGSVTADARALTGDMLDRWRAGLAYVSQEATVFNDSVRRNLLAEGARADDDRLWAVLESVGLAERIRSLPDGLDQLVGDRGSQLSGGEQQRLVLARALLRKPSLLILDEGTAALDSDAEAALLGRVRASAPRLAALVIAHRQSTLAHCDSVVSIRHGKLGMNDEPSG